jgi:hypothetical protein
MEKYVVPHVSSYTNLVIYFLVISVLEFLNNLWGLGTKQE